ncbi:hypothetical protein ACTZWW_04445 [Salinarimonas sp. NSM]|uniref:hypothetical protein n=1 Tax=Salinarimonas sp. NSM TaxID=3458003 RepID=UPI0040368F0F
MPPRPPRRAVPLAVQVQVAKRQLAELMIRLGMIPVVVMEDGTERDARPDEVALDLDHTPALGMRPVNADGTDYDPPQHDPGALVWRPQVAIKGMQGHREKTHGRRLGESRNARREPGDVTMIAKARRVEKANAEFRARLLAKVDPDAEPPPARKRKHTIPSRPFPTGKRPMRTRALRERTTEGR